VGVEGMLVMVVMVVMMMMMMVMVMVMVMMVMVMVMVMMMMRMVVAMMLQKVLTGDEFEDYLSHMFQLAIDSNVAIFRCPSVGCGGVFEKLEKVAAEFELAVMREELDEGLRPLSLEAKRHKEEFRFRCRQCGTEFCSRWCWCWCWWW